MHRNLIVFNRSRSLLDMYKAITSTNSFIVNNRTLDHLACFVLHKANVTEQHIAA